MDSDCLGSCLHPYVAATCSSTCVGWPLVCLSSPSSRAQSVAALPRSASQSELASLRPPGFLFLCFLARQVCLCLVLPEHSCDSHVEPRERVDEI
jgi:hypothetical protein